MRPDDIKPKDLRKYSILPFNAVMDKRINRTRALHVLAALCSYVDQERRNLCQSGSAGGGTWAYHARLSISN